MNGLRVGGVRAALIAVAACYAVLAHLAVETASVPLTLACLALLTALLLGPAMARGSGTAWALAGAAAAALSLAPARSWVWLPLYAPSVLGDVFVAWVFGHTLAAGRVPLIERMARLLHAQPGEPLEAPVAGYARRLTAAWAILFVVLGATSLGLALCASPNGVLQLLGIAPPVTIPQTVWSWFANVGEYAVAAVFFAGEFAYRRRRFPEQPHASLLEFTRRLLAVAPEVLDFRRGGPAEPGRGRTARPRAASDA